MLSALQRTQTHQQWTTTKDCSHENTERTPGRERSEQSTEETASSDKQIRRRTRHRSEENSRTAASIQISFSELNTSTKWIQQITPRTSASCAKRRYTTQNTSSSSKSWWRNWSQGICGKSQRSDEVDREMEGRMEMVWMHAIIILWVVELETITWWIWWWW